MSTPKVSFADLGTHEQQLIDQLEKLREAEDLAFQAAKMKVDAERALIKAIVAQGNLDLLKPNLNMIRRWAYRNSSNS